MNRSINRILRWLSEISRLTLRIEKLQSQKRGIRNLISDYKKEMRAKDVARKDKRIVLMALMVLRGKTIADTAKRFGVSPCACENYIRTLLFTRNEAFFCSHWKGFYDRNTNTSPNKYNGLGTVNLLRKYYSEFGLVFEK